MRRVPVLVVSGYLGSGKTTLVRHLLAAAAQSGVRLAVVSNEFGELGIDAALLASAGDGYVELAGGCVCCRLSDELVESLEALRERVDPDRIVIETSGAALPYDVQLQLWREPVARWVEDDVAVVVVNAEQLFAGRDLDDCFEQQVSNADLLILNQLDRVPQGVIPALEAQLRELEPEAPILRAEHARVAPELLFPTDPLRSRERRRAESGGAAPHVHEAIESSVIELAAGTPWAEIAERVRREAPLRAKGFVRAREGLCVVQAVGPRVELEPVPAEPPPELVGRVVVIRRARGAAVKAAGVS
jgi:cobalamin biosynthesis protein CobW